MSAVDDVEAILAASDSSDDEGLLGAYSFRFSSIVCSDV